MPLVTSSTRSTGYIKIRASMDSYREFLPPKCMVFDAFLLIEILYVVPCTVDHMGDFVHSQKLKILTE